MFLSFAATACVWTPIVPLTDAYALRGVARYGLNYGPLRLWGSAAFVVGALACGLLVDVIAAQHLIWVIAAVAVLGAAVSLGLQPLDRPGAAPAACTARGAAARSRLSRHHPGLGADPGQPCGLLHVRLDHLAGAGLGGLTIAGLWALGVLAEIVVFALSPRFTLAAGDAGGDRRAQRGGALADHGAGAAGRDARAWCNWRTG